MILNTTRDPTTDGTNVPHRRDKTPPNTESPSRSPQISSRIRVISVRATTNIRGAHERPRSVRVTCVPLKTERTPRGRATEAEAGGRASQYRRLLSNPGLCFFEKSLAEHLYTL